MNLTMKINQYHDNCLFFSEPIKNNVMSDGNFIRILYSDEDIVINGIYLTVNLNDISCEKFYNKYKCNFNVHTHKQLIDDLKLIEENILRKYKTTKLPSNKIYDQMKSGYIKLFDDIGNSKQNCTFILKISGIWETANSYGLTYKFLKVV